MISLWYFSTGINLKDSLPSVFITATCGIWAQVTEDNQLLCKDWSSRIQPLLRMLQYSTAKMEPKSIHTSGKKYSKYWFKTLMVFYECVTEALQSSFQPITTDLVGICKTYLSKPFIPMPCPPREESLQLRKIELSTVLQQHFSHFKRKLLVNLIHNTLNVHGTSEANFLWLVSAINLRGQFLQKVF